MSCPPCLCPGSAPVPYPAQSDLPWKHRCCPDRGHFQCHTVPVARSTDRRRRSASRGLPSPSGRPSCAQSLALAKPLHVRGDKSGVIPAHAASPRTLGRLRCISRLPRARHKIQFVLAQSESGRSTQRELTSKVAHRRRDRRATSAGPLAADHMCRPAAGRSHNSSSPHLGPGERGRRPCSLTTVHHRRTGSFEHGSRKGAVAPEPHCPACPWASILAKRQRKRPTYQSVSGHPNS